MVTFGDGVFFKNNKICKDYNIDSMSKKLFIHTHSCYYEDEDIELESYFYLKDENRKTIMSEVAYVPLENKYINFNLNFKIDIEKYPFIISGDNNNCFTELYKSENKNNSSLIDRVLNINLLNYIKNNFHDIRFINQDKDMTWLSNYKDDLRVLCYKHIYGYFRR